MRKLAVAVLLLASASPVLAAKTVGGPVAPSFARDFRVAPPAGSGSFTDPTASKFSPIINPRAVGGGPGGPPAVPEPATWLMFLAGFGALGFAMRRQRRVVSA